jgi:hypothetical protein
MVFEILVAAVRRWKKALEFLFPCGEEQKVARMCVLALVAELARELQVAGIVVDELEFVDACLQDEPIHSGT